MTQIDFTKDASDCHVVLDVQSCAGGASLVISRTDQSLPFGEIEVTGFADVVAELDFYKPESIDVLIEKLQAAKNMLAT